MFQLFHFIFQLVTQPVLFALQKDSILCSFAFTYPLSAQAQPNHIPRLQRLLHLRRNRSLGKRLPRC